MKTIELGRSGHSMKCDIGRLIESRALVTARSGGGKSWLLRLLIELAAGDVQVFVIDPEGEFASLREVVPMLLASREGEVPVSPKTANVLAHKLLELNLSCVIDLCELKSNDRREFARSFLDALMAMPKSMWRPLVVVIDEAHMFCPERSAGESVATLSVIDLMSRGRKRGICGVLATQRLAKLHKDAAAEASNVFVGSTVLDVDVARAGDLLGFDKQGRQSLRTLAEGEFFAFGPALDATGVKRFISGTPRSSHPKLGSRSKVSAPATPKAIAGLLPTLRESLKHDEGQVYDLDDARKRITDLEKQLKAKSSVVASPASSAEMVELKQKLHALEKHCQELTRAYEQRDAAFATRNAKVLAALQGVVELVAPGMPSAPLPTKIMIVHKSEATSLKATIGPSPTVSRPKPAAAPSVDGLGRCERAILAVLAQHPEGRNRNQLGIQAEYSASSGSFRNAISKLNTNGLIGKNGDLVVATPEGIAAAGDVQPLPVGQELIDHWLAKLGKAERAILEVLVKAYPDSMDKDAIGDMSGYSSGSGSFRNSLSRLRTLELITGKGNERIRASAAFFE